MTPPVASVQSQPHTSHLQHPADDNGHHARTDRFAVGHWTSDTADGNAVWSSASYWVRRKRAQAMTDAGA